MPTSLAPSGVDHDLVRRMKTAEDARFAADHPRSAELLARGRSVMPNGVPMAWHRGQLSPPPACGSVEGSGAHFTDVDGHTYRDFNIADMSMFCGYAPAAAGPRRGDRMARGNQFLLPSRRRHRRVRGASSPLRTAEMAVHDLGDARQYRGDPRRAGRDGPRRLLLFDGKYHGHLDAGAGRAGLRPASSCPRSAASPRDVVAADRRRAVQRSDGPGASARAARHRARPHRTGAHEQLRPHPAGSRLPRRAARGSTRARDAARATTRPTRRWWGRAA